MNNRRSFTGQRLKKIGTCRCEYEIYQILKDLGRVSQIWERHLNLYSKAKKTIFTGDIVHFKSGEYTIVAIKSSHSIKYTTHYLNKKNQIRTRVSRYVEFFELTKEGWDYLKGQVLEEQV